MDIARLFPTIDAPAFLINGSVQHGGTITPGSNLRFAASNGTVYYTTDGSDPRLFGGGINPNAATYTSVTTTEQLIPTNSSWKYFDKGTDLGSAWRSTSYNDTTWASGNAELGYGDGDEATVVSFGPNSSNRYITTYFRRTFNVSNPSEITNVILDLKRDDGAVVYINGVEVARSNMPTGTITAATLASTAIVPQTSRRFINSTSIRLC